MAKYPNTLGRIEAVWNKLGGEEGVDRFLRGELEVVAKVVVAVVFSVWKTLLVGTFRSVKEVKAAFKKAGMNLGDYAADILGKSSLGELGQSSQEFVRVKVSDLGFTGQATLRDILAAGKARGLKLCEPEDGPAIRLFYLGQLMNEVVWLAMEPVKDSDGRWSVLSVSRRHDGLWLSTKWNALAGVWLPELEFFFRRVV